MCIFNIVLVMFCFNNFVGRERQTRENRAREQEITFWATELWLDHQRLQGEARHLNCNEERQRSPNGAVEEERRGLQVHTRRFREQAATRKRRNWETENTRHGDRADCGLAPIPQCSAQEIPETIWRWVYLTQSVWVQKFNRLVA